MTCDIIGGEEKVVVAGCQTTEENGHRWRSMVGARGLQCAIYQSVDVPLCYYFAPAGGFVPLRGHPKVSSHSIWLKKKGSPRQFSKFRMYALDWSVSLWPQREL